MHKYSNQLEFKVEGESTLNNLNIKWDPEWDKVDTTATEVAEYEGEQLYKMNP